jgi:sporulation protein YlmC with PRC-barrel domain
MKHDNEIVKAKDEVINVDVKNQEGEDLGKISEIMLDKESGTVVYAVLESGSFLGLGGKLFAIPWKAFHYDPDKECFELDASSDKIKNAPGFDKNNWPNMADRTWGASISEYYETPVYWE